MENVWLTLLLSLLLFLILLHNYEEMEEIPASKFCSPKRNICVLCPSSGPRPPHTLNFYRQFQFSWPFHVLSAQLKLPSSSCRDLLDILDHTAQGQWVFQPAIKALLETGELAWIEGEQVTVRQGKKFHASLGPSAGFAVFYAGAASGELQLRQESQTNPARLMKMSRSICWGFLLALVLNYLDSKLGIWRQPRHQPMPYLEALVAILQLYHSYSSLRLGNLHLVELVFSGYLLSQLWESHRLSPSVQVGWTVLLVLFSLLIDPRIAALGYLGVVAAVKARVPRLKDSPQKLQVAVALSGFCLLTSLPQCFGTLNYLAYFSFACKIVAIPLGLVLFQQPDPEQSVLSH